MELVVLKKMNPTNTQIIEFFRAGQEPADIAAGLGYELAYVLNILWREGEFSRVKPTASHPEEELTRAQRIFKENEEAFAKVISDVAIYGENESAKVKAAIYACEEIHGRNAARVRGGRLNGGLLNIGQLQIHMGKASEAVSRALGNGNKSSAIDIQAEVAA